MSKDEDKFNIDMEEVFVFPHVRYTQVNENSNPYYIYKKYIGKHKSLTNGKIYQFHQAMFSPNRETLRRKVWITQSDMGPYVRYEDTRGQWVNTTKPKQR